MTEEDSKNQSKTQEDERDEEEEAMDPEKEARMLLNPPADSVQFTGSTNGVQVTLPLSSVKSGVGMTKAELMKYANDPFWVRLRMGLFILFWIVWLAMLIGAIAIIALVPGCPSTAKLPWWKKCSLVQLSIQNDAPNFKEKMIQATKDIDSLKNNLDSIKQSEFDGLIFSGVNPFFLVSSTNNSANDDYINFRTSFLDLVQTSHNTDIGLKLIMSLRLSEISTSNDWFLKSAQNKTGYKNMFIWRADTNKQNLKDINFDYNLDRLSYAFYKTPGNALLNYGSEETIEKIKPLVIDWVRTRLDGIQSENDFFVDDGDIHPSQNVAAMFRKWVKTGGDNKAFFVANSEFSDKLNNDNDNDNKDAEVSKVYELSPDSSVWQSLINSKDIKNKLEEIYKNIISDEDKLGISNKTSKDYSSLNADQVGEHWKTLKIQYSENDKNSIASQNGLTIAEGITAAFFMMPKVTPIIEVQADHISKLKSNRFLPKLHQIRKTHSDALLLGKTKMPSVSDTEVFAVQRIFHQKNSLLLLINFSSVSKEITLSGDSLPNMIKHQAKVILVDSKSSKDLIDSTIQFPSFKIDSKQVLVIEFVPIE